MGEHSMVMGSLALLLLGLPKDHSMTVHHDESVYLQMRQGSCQACLMGLQRWQEWALSLFLLLNQVSSEQ